MTGSVRLLRARGSRRADRASPTAFASCRSRGAGRSRRCTPSAARSTTSSTRSRIRRSRASSSPGGATKSPPSSAASRSTRWRWRSAEVVGSYDAAARALRRDHRRHGDGPRPESLPGFRDARALLPPRRRRRRPAVGAHLRLRGRAHARLRATSSASPSSSPTSSATSARTRSAGASICRRTKCSASA